MSKVELTKEERIKRSLNNSILDGAFYSLKTGLADSFFTVFGVFLKATNFELGLLGSLPLAISSMFQLISHRLIHVFGSRMRLILTAGLLHGLSLLAMIILFVMGKLSVPTMIMLVVLYWIFDRIAYPAWNSLMGDLVAESARGRYFARRNRIIYFSTFIGLVIGAVILGVIHGSQEAKAQSFVVIFSLATVARFISLYYLKKMWEPQQYAPLKPPFGLWEFLVNAKRTNFGNFVLYMMFMNLAVYIAAPFFAVYLLKDFGLTYFQYTLILGVAVVTKFLSLPLWGKASDRYGTRKILALSGFLIPLVPFLYMVKRDLNYFLYIEAFSGFVWAGFELACFNYILDSTSSEKRATCVQYYNFLDGVGLIIGSFIGTYILTHNSMYWSSFILVFLVSGIVRMLVSIVFLPRIHEIRRVEGIMYSELFFNVLTVGPTMGSVLRIISFNEREIKKLIQKTGISKVLEFDLKDKGK